MSGKLSKKLFTQAIPFFAMAYMLFAVLWISADYVLAFLDKPPVGELSVQLAVGIPIALVAVVVSAGFDHWLQDHYGVNPDGGPQRRGIPKEENEHTN